MSFQLDFLIDSYNLSFIHRLLRECYEEDPCAAPEQQLILQAKTPYPTVPCFSLLVPAGVGVSPVTLAEEAGQEVLPGGGPRLHPPALSIFLCPILTHLICSFHRQRPERDLAESLNRALPGGFGWLRSRACWVVVVAMEQQDKKQVSLVLSSASTYVT